MAQTQTKSAAAAIAAKTKLSVEGVNMVFRADGSAVNVLDNINLEIQDGAAILFIDEIHTVIGAGATSGS